MLCLLPSVPPRPQRVPDDTAADLLTMRKKLEEGQYKASQDFAADVKLMCSNCREFNQTPGNVYVICADKLEAYFLALWRGPAAAT